MTTLRQRQPRRPDPDYLAWLRRQACACCGMAGPCDAAHVRASSARHEKPITGIGQKPDDRWALPLRHAHHMELHAHGDEQGWWQQHGVRDVFELCLHYRRLYRKERGR